MSLHGPPPPSGSGTTVSVLVTDDQMRRLDYPWASPSRDAPVEPLGDGRATLFGETCEPPSRRTVAKFHGASSEASRKSAQQVLQVLARRAATSTTISESHARRNRHRIG